MTQTRVFKVSGMNCAHCERAVERALSAIEGVEAAKADHARAAVTLTLHVSVTDAAVAAAVKGAGYRLG